MPKIERERERVGKRIGRDEQDTYINSNLRFNVRDRTRLDSFTCGNRTAAIKKHDQFFRSQIAPAVFIFASKKTASMLHFSFFAIFGNAFGFQNEKTPITGEEMRN